MLVAIPTETLIKLPTRKRFWEYDQLFLCFYRNGKKHQIFFHLVLNGQTRLYMYMCVDNVTRPVNYDTI